MTESKRIAILGGDARQIAAARYLAFLGHTVLVWGLGDCTGTIGNARICDAWETAVDASEVVLLPLPATEDGLRIRCPHQENGVAPRFSELLKHAYGRLLLGGKLPETVCRMAEMQGVRTLDYFDSEFFQLKNAIPTAEGALAIAMQELPVTLYGSRAAVLGYGRIGEVLAARLREMGSYVTVFARRAEQRVRAELALHSVGSLPLAIGGDSLAALAACRVVFNTVPHRILTEELLPFLRGDCLLIDLASPPGGIDFGAAQRLGFSSVWATALPGKVAPESAGEILAKTVLALLEDS